MIRLIMGLAMAFLVTACASLSKDECLNADWHLIGFEDGSSGHALDRVGRHRKACASVNVVPDIGRYETGHEKGARQYCTRARGYAEGVKGAAYYGICPLDLVDEFLQAYRDGQALYQVDKQLDELMSAIVATNHRMDEIDADIAYHEGEIISAMSGSRSRAEHLAIIRDLRNELTALQIDLVNMEEQKQMLNEDYHYLVNEHRKLGY